MGPTAFTMQMDCDHDSWTCTTAVQATLSVSGSSGSVLTHTHMCSERIYTAQAISEKQPRFTFISSAAQQDPGTGSICIDSHFDSSYSLICLLIHSLIHFIWLPGQQSSSKFTHRSLLDGCFAHPWYKWVRTNFSTLRAVCFISISLNTSPALA